MRFREQPSAALPDFQPMEVSAMLSDSSGWSHTPVNRVVPYHWPATGCCGHPLGEWCHEDFHQSERRRSP